MKLRLAIQTHLTQLTKSEQLVADYVLENTEQVLHMTLGELSKATGVGEATVLRFCNKIGYEKFGSLKLNIAMDLSEQEDDSSIDATLISKVGSSITEAVNDTMELLKEEDIKKAVNYIENCSHLWFYGVGSSGLSALQAEANFTRIGLFSSAIIDPHFQAMNASVLSKDDVVVAFSISGSTTDIYESCKIAKESGSKIIVITNFIGSPIASLADVVLLTAAKEHVLKGGTITGSISQLCVLDCLKLEYVRRHEKEMKVLKKKCADSIIQKQM